MMTDHEPINTLPFFNTHNSIISLSGTMDTRAVYLNSNHPAATLKKKKKPTARLYGGGFGVVFFV